LPETAKTRPTPRMQRNTIRSASAGVPKWVRSPPRRMTSQFASAARILSSDPNCPCRSVMQSSFKLNLRRYRSLAVWNLRDPIDSIPSALMDTLTPGRLGTKGVLLERAPTRVGRTVRSKACNLTNGGIFFKIRDLTQKLFPWDGDASVCQSGTDGVGDSRN